MEWKWRHSPVIIFFVRHILTDHNPIINDGGVWGRTFLCGVCWDIGNELPIHVAAWAGQRLLRLPGVPAWAAARCHLPLRDEQDRPRALHTLLPHCRGADGSTELSLSRSQMTKCVPIGRYPNHAPS